ncbi:T9SS type A sorting domain-containing protein, partial [bacterium]
PRALYIDEVRSTLWLADYSNHRVLRYDLPRENVQMVKVNAPNGGETYSIGKIYPISWSSNSVENVKLEYSSNNGSDWNEITVVPSVNGSFAWTVPDAASEQALVRVSNVADANVSDVSDAVFTIAPPVEVVTVVSPNGFQHWGKASKKNILFTTQDVASVDLYFSDNNGQSWNSIATSVSAASGSYLWELPNATSNQMLVKVTKAGDMNVDDVSDATFAIVEPMEGHEQDYIFFADSPTPNFYDPSWNSVTAPSTLLRVGEKMPVSAEYSFTGTYSIKLNWKSMTGGNWAAAIAGVGWPGRDLTSKDTLEFRVFTTTALAIADMPFIYLEDLSNQKSTKLPLGTLTNSFEANTWNLVKIPTSTFVENKGGADLTRVKTVFFGQNAADEVEHTLFIDDMRASGGEIITGEDRNLIVVIGSSTSAGIGASTSDSSYVGRLRKWVLDRDPNAYVINLAVGGYTSYDLMASDFVPPSGRPAPKVNNNITYALTYKPDAIIMNLPSNDANIGMTIEEQVSNFDAIVAQAGDIPMWITTTQPRNFTETAKRESLMQMRDSILTKYGDRAIEIFTELAEADGTIKAKYNSGDGIHLNDSGHKYIFEQVVATGFWGVVTPIENGTEVIKEFQLFQNYPNPFNPTTQIRFNLANSTQNVVLTVYDILGRKVATLINGSMGAGAHTVNFDASRYASGTYIYRLQAGENVSVKKMTLVK